MVQQSRIWCFTWNNYTNENIDQLNQLYNDGVIEFIIFGKEIAPTTNTPHLQGVVRFKNRKRLGGIKSLLGDDIHFEVCKHFQNAILYCKKEDPNPTILGQPETQQGKRTDIDEIKELVFVKKVISKSVWLMEYAELYEKKQNLIDQYIELFHQSNVPKIKDNKFTKWQMDLQHTLEMEVPDRLILFILDYTGGKGKTWFADKYEELNTDTTQILNPAQTTNLAYLYKRTSKVVFFDCPLADVADQNMYSIFEQIKNGRVQSTKYQCTIKRFKPPHLIVFVNDIPFFDKLSKDRTRIYELTDDDNEKPDDLHDYVPKNLYSTNFCPTEEHYHILENRRLRSISR